MDTNKILKSDYLDILFEGRNKKYGGYYLRKTYVNRVRNASFIGIGLMVLAIIGPAIAGKPIETIRPITRMDTIHLTPPPPIDPVRPQLPPPPSNPPPPLKTTIKFPPPVITKDSKVNEDEKPPEQNQIKDVTIGAKTQTGDINGIDAPILDNPGTGPGVAEPPAPAAIFKYVAQMPISSEDVNAYMVRHIHYPEAAKETNTEGRVILQFVVNEDGAISNIVVLRGIGAGCDEEAKRVLASMPPWKPGRQNGRAVKVYFTIPVLFKLN